MDIIICIVSRGKTNQRSTERYGKCKMIITAMKKETEGRRKMWLSITITNNIKSQSRIV